jgi:hypothetical protein
MTKTLAHTRVDLSGSTVLESIFLRFAPRMPLVWLSVVAMAVTGCLGAIKGGLRAWPR